MQSGKDSGREFFEGRSPAWTQTRDGQEPLTAARLLKEEGNFERLQSRREITRSAEIAKAVFPPRLSRTDDSGRELLEAA